MQLSLLDFLGLLLSGTGVQIEGCNYVLWPGVLHLKRSSGGLKGFNTLGAGDEVYLDPLTLEWTLSSPKKQSGHNYSMLTAEGTAVS